MNTTVIIIGGHSLISQNRTLDNLQFGEAIRNIRAPAVMPFYDF